MNTAITLNYRIVCLACCTILLFLIPAGAAGDSFTRSISPITPEPGEIVSVTLIPPSGFFGGIIEELPEGISYAGSSHPTEGVRQHDQTIIFAITGEERVIYSVNVAPGRCGVITGKYENIKTKESGIMPQTVVAPIGSDPFSCSKTAAQSSLWEMTALAGICITAVLVRRSTEKGQ